MGGPSNNIDLGASLFPAGSQGVGTYLSADQSNLSHTGAAFAVSISAGTGTITITVQGKDPLSGAYYNVGSFAASPAGVGESGFMLYPGAGTGGLAFPLPPVWRLSVAVGTAAVTATIAASLLY